MGSRGRGGKCRAERGVPGLRVLRGVIGTSSRRIVVIATACALLVSAATLVTFRLAESPRTDPALGGLITQITTVPVGKLVPTSARPPSAYSSTLLFTPGTLKAVSGPPLTSGGKPEVLYVATGYCPYCAAFLRS